MNNEQKKLLLVAVSVGVFLLITFTVAMSVLTPRTQMEEAVFTSSRPYQATRNQNNIGTAVAVPEDTALQIQPEPNNNIVTVTEAANTIDRNNGDQLTISIPRPETVAIPGTTVTVTAPAAETVPATPSTVTVTAPARTTVQQTPAPAASTASSTGTASSGTATSSTASPAQSTRTTSSNAASSVPTTVAARSTAPRQTSTQTRTINDYWVQTHAFSRLFRAEDVKELLASKGITSIIESPVIDGQILYRVRLGPYTSEREANYWLALVQSIDGFESSQIRQTVRQQ